MINFLLTANDCWEKVSVVFRRTLTVKRVGPVACEKKELGLFALISRAQTTLRIPVHDARSKSVLSFFADTHISLTQ